jgi:dTDP-4-dehydrorhamnose reductase
MIWLIGNKGMLGTEIALQLGKFNMPFIGTDREVDITNSEALGRFVEKQMQPFTWIINCAAYTAVDKAEDDVEACRRVNTDGPNNIAIVARQNGAHLIQISTDYVFDGIGIVDSGNGHIRPYREDDPANPSSVYGLTKRDGEIAVMQHTSQSYIIRTSWLYGKHGGNFVTTMLQLMKEKDEIKVVDDQWGSPTWADDLAKIILEIIKVKQECHGIPYGIYHYSNKGSITWFNFAWEIYEQGCRFRLLDKNFTVKPCASTEYRSRVKRPVYSVLDKTKIETALGIDIPAWNESLGNYLGQLVEINK